MIPAQAVGLLIDIAGVLVIAIPDIPYLNRYTRGGRLRQARVMLPTVGLTHAMTGFDTVIEEIGEYDVDIEPRPDVISIERPEDSRWDLMYAHYSTGSETMDNQQLTDIPWRAMEVHIHEQIKKSEGRIRAFGFGILGVGFIIQIIAIL